MKSHDIFLFTSDRHEGWGAVVNEAMSNGCIVVSSDAAGCTPYLINHRINGCSFKSGNINSLESEILWLYEHKALFYDMKSEALSTIHNYWNASSASSALLTLINALFHGIDSVVTKGPASKDLPK